MDQLIAIFCDIDDFCQAFEPVYARRLLHVGQRQRARRTALTLSETLTLLVYFHWSHYRTFKHYYTEYVAVHLRPYFPQLVSYQRFIELLPRALVPLCGYLATRKGRCTGIAFIDSTPLAVCDNHRIATHKVFEGLARRGKTHLRVLNTLPQHLYLSRYLVLPVRMRSGSLLQPASYCGFLMHPLPWTATQKTLQARQAHPEACFRPAAVHLLPQRVQPQPAE